MKKVLITVAFLSLGVVSTYAQNPKPVPQAAPAANPKAPQFKFKGGDTHDFGELKEGPVAEYKFEFTNTGKEPLVIQNATASCGCTTPEWPKQPILPGKTGTIVVKYNTVGRPGPFVKDIWIQSNVPGERYPLHIKGTVKPASGAATDKPKS